MLPKILIIFINLLVIKLVLSKNAYSATPTITYATGVPSAQNYPATLSPSATTLRTALPSTLTASAAPVTSSASLLSTASSKPTTASASLRPTSSSTEAKAYFLPGPIPEPKVTILADMPSVVEVKPRLSTDHIMDLNPRADPGFIEVIGKFCDPKNVNIQTDASKPVLPTLRENSVSPVKRLTMACSDNEPFLSADSSPYLQNQQPVCPGISKLDFVLVTPTLVEGNINNPIEYEGLLDGFFTYLEAPRQC